MNGAIVIGALLAANVGAPEQETGILILQGEVLRIGDIAVGAPESDLIVARIPDRRSSLLLSEEQRRALLRARLPGAHFVLRQKDALLVRRGAASTTVPFLGGPCYAMRFELPAGQYISRDEVAETDCTGAAGDRRLRYDRHAAAPVTRAAIPAGAYLGRLRLPDSSPLAAGEKLLLQTRIGAVSVERSVTTLQPGRPGKRLFVRTAEGKLLASRLASRLEGDRP